ncbi:MAG: hypothetical protein ABS46_02570 [Cytophagaceae bacterium SCN 52-12]|nr:MAG: hypothetical protein ABS46_02570 [Cytophagaceae bacterium SCN 52-12]
MTDTDLWNAFRKGERDAFRQIYDRYSRELMSYGYRITDDDSLVEDAVHDLFIELWHAKKLSETDSIKFYLFAALRRKLANLIRSRNNLYGNGFEASEPGLQASPIEDDLIEREGEQQLLEQLHRSYLLLTDRQQQALHLRFYMHFSNEEIARIMGVNYQSACKFIYTGLKALRETVRIL